MSGSLNKVTLIGNLGRDPEVRNTQSGDQIVHLSVATSENWRDRQSGERRERTEWHRVVIFSQPLGDIAKQYLRKGSKVYLEGQLQTRKWTDQSGNDKYTTEITLRPFNGALLLLDEKQRDSRQEYIDAAQPVNPGGGPDLSDEIPFSLEWR